MKDRIVVRRDRMLPDGRVESQILLSTYLTTIRTHARLVCNPPKANLFTSLPGAEGWVTNVAFHTDEVKKKKK